jgi:hypothetical protein
MIGECFVDVIYKGFEKPSMRLLLCRLPDQPYTTPQPMEKPTQPTRILQTRGLSRLNFIVAGVARLQCLNEKPNFGEFGYHCQQAQSGSERMYFL